MSEVGNKFGYAGTFAKELARPYVYIISLDTSGNWKCWIWADIVSAKHSRHCYPLSIPLSHYKRARPEIHSEALA
jgi:hypothetical protein